MEDSPAAQNACALNEWFASKDISSPKFLVPHTIDASVEECTAELLEFTKEYDLEKLSKKPDSVELSDL